MINFSATTPSADAAQGITFEGEAYDTMWSMLQNLRGYGVRVNSAHGFVVEGILRRPTYDHDGVLAVEVYGVVSWDDVLTVDEYEQAEARPLLLTLGTVHVF